MVGFLNSAAVLLHDIVPFNSSPEAHKVSKSNDFTKNSLNNSSVIAMNPETD